MESVEDEEGQTDPGDDSPGQEAVEPELHFLGHHRSVCHKGVEDPEGDVGKQEEGDQLTTGLGQLLGTTSGH